LLQGYAANVTGYVILKYLHIVLAIVAIGFNASYGFWLARAGREPEHALHVLRGIRVLDNRFANPAYGLLLLTGVGLLFMGQIPFTTFWIAASLVLYVLAVIVAAAVFTPTLRRQIAAVETQGAMSDEYKRLASRARTVGIVMIVLVLLIELLMVTKPTI
jgi:uncharacterized membrane protein